MWANWSRLADMPMYIGNGKRCRLLDQPVLPDERIVLLGCLLALFKRLGLHNQR